MDNLTHSLVGALIGQAGLKRKTGLAMPALIIGANIPDVDAACLFWLDGIESLAFRRGITHGPIAWVLLPLVLAGALWWFDFWQTRRDKRPEGRLPVHFGWLFGLSVLACLTHPALDWLNSYGVRLLEPFSHRWFYGDVLFIIDVWLWVLLGFATWFSLRRERAGGEGRRPARLALALGLAYVAVNAFLTSLYQRHDAIYAQLKGFPPERATVIASPLPLLSLGRERLVGEDGRWFVRKARGADDILIEPVTDTMCAWPDLAVQRAGDPHLDAFLFWARAPFADRAMDGSIIVRDARYLDPAARDRFSVAVPDVKCQPRPRGG